jgi:hypothetical protein
MAWVAGARNDPIVWRSPFSRTSKSSCVRFVTGFPPRSRTTTSTTMAVTMAVSPPTARGAGCGELGACAARAALASSRPTTGSGVRIRTSVRRVLGKDARFKGDALASLILCRTAAFGCGV